jgi:hypothetical protein
LLKNPVAVVFHADWCPTCRAQAPAFKPLTLYVANFYTEKTLKRSLGATQQSSKAPGCGRRARGVKLGSIEGDYGRGSERWEHTKHDRQRGGGERHHC